MKRGVGGLKVVGAVLVVKYTLTLLFTTIPRPIVTTGDRVGLAIKAAGSTGTKSAMAMHLIKDGGPKLSAFTTELTCSSSSLRCMKAA